MSKYIDMIRYNGEDYHIGNIYSLTELAIGTWINGKPLYRKSFSLAKTQIQTEGGLATEYLTTTPVLETDNPEEILIDKTHSFLRRTNGAIMYDSTTYTNEAYAFSIRGINSKGHIQFFIGNKFYEQINEIFITLEYTKTTD